jgi:hypothetical protein
MLLAHARWLVPLTICCAVPQLVLTFTARGLFAFDRGRTVETMMHSWNRTELLLPLAISLAIFGGLWVLLMIVSQLFFGAALFSSLGAAGRGEPLSLGLAFERGLASFGAYIGVSLWVGLRLMAWTGLFIGGLVIAIVAATHERAWMLIPLVPAMIFCLVMMVLRAFAWLFAMPARMAGDTSSARASIPFSTAATDGRKGYLFAFNLLMGLIIGGMMIPLGGTGAILGLALGPLGSQTAEVASTLFGAVAGVVVVLGHWLAYADAIAPYRPASAAAPYALGVSGRPFPPPTFRRA